MWVKKREGTREKKILTAMIVNRQVLSRISSRWERGLFSSPWSNLIAGWCVDFYQKFDQPPNKSIEGLFQEWAEQHPDKDTVETVDRFLVSLSGEYEALNEGINPQYVIDLADKHMNGVKALRLREAIEKGMES